MRKAIQLTGKSMIDINDAVHSGDIKAPKGVLLLEGTLVQHTRSGDLLQLFRSNAAAIFAATSTDQAPNTLPAPAHSLIIMMMIIIIMRKLWWFI